MCIAIYKIDSKAQCSVLTKRGYRYFVFVVVVSLGQVPLFVIPCNIACQVSLPMGFPRQEHLSRLPFPSPGDLPNPRIKSVSPILAGRFFTTELPGKPDKCTSATDSLSCTVESDLIL